MNDSAQRLIEAAKQGRLDEVRRILAIEPGLVDSRAESGETPLMAALYRGHREIVGVLLDGGAPVDVFTAAALGRMDALESSLAQPGQSVNGFAYDGWTPLHLAAFFGHVPAVERLLAADADMTAISQNSLRNTPLHAAVAGGHVHAAQLLIERGAPVNVADAGGHTPLHIAAEAGYAPIVKALLERGADPHAVDAEEKTPLARAAARNHNAVIDLINLSPKP